MLGEGLPWHIILPFFFLGIFLGINAGKKEMRKTNATNS
jgi:hypothetical protein